jgi:hypothetical protein
MTQLGVQPYLTIMASERNLKASSTGVVHMYEVRRFFKHDAMASLSSLEHAEKAMLITARTPAQIGDVMYILK